MAKWSDDMKNYTYLGSSDGRRFCISGIDVFSVSWNGLGQCDIVLHPKTKRPYSFSLYSVTSGNRSVTFLAGHFDDNDWHFYKELSDEDIIF